jgi:hypothetical protein
MILVSKGIVPEFLATVVPPEEEEVDIAADMLIANEGKPFLPLEEAAMLQRMREKYGWSQKQIADKIGRSNAHVNNRLALLGADDSIKEALKVGELKTQEALAIVHKSHGDKNMQKEIVERKKSGEKGVVNKELLKGRFNKEQWDIIHGTYKGLEAFQVSPEKIQDILVSDNDEIQQAFIAGCFQNCADLAFTDILDFYSKVQERVKAERENAPVKVSAAKDFRAEIEKEKIVEPPKAERKPEPAPLAQSNKKQAKKSTKKDVKDSDG